MHNRRRLLIANSQQGGGYVTDGLVLFLDGLNQGGVSGKWIDTVNSTEFTLNGDATATTKSVLLTNGYIRNATDVEFATIELVLRKSANSYGMVHQGNHNAYRSVTIDTNPSFSITFGGKSNAKRTTYPQNAIFSAVGIFDVANNTYDSIKINNETPTYSTVQNDWPHASYGMTFGRNSFDATEYSTIDELFAVRLYNRVLTDAELSQNFNLDVARYGIS